jgi:hypothetical protein
LLQEKKGEKPHPNWENRMQQEWFHTMVNSSKAKISRTKRGKVPMAQENRKM